MGIETSTQKLKQAGLESEIKLDGQGLLIDGMKICDNDDKAAIYFSRMFCDLLIIKKFC